MKARWAAPNPALQRTRRKRRASELARWAATPRWPGGTIDVE